MIRYSVVRFITLIITFGLLAACAGKEDLSGTPEPMGDFLLGHNIVVAKDAQQGPLSRKADPDDWETALKEAIEKDLGRYDGDHYFHIGTHVDAYVLAVPGVPLVATPKSVLIISVNVWDDRTQEKLTEEPKQFTVFERSEKSTFIIGSGIANSKAAQMRNLSRNAARLIRLWLLQNKQWFGVAEDTALAPDGENKGATGN